MEKLELKILVKTNKRIEFQQTLSNLSNKLKAYSSCLNITRSDDLLSYSIIAKCESKIQIQETLKREEFEILFGAITALCETIEIRYNDKHISNHISMLGTLKNKNFNI